jgi:hypothetical protein
MKLLFCFLGKFVTEIVITLSTQATTSLLFALTSSIHMSQKTLVWYASPNSLLHCKVVKHYTENTTELQGVEI